MVKRLTKAEKAVFERIKEEVAKGIETPEGLMHFMTTYAGSGAHTEMNPLHYTTVCVGPTGRAVQTREGSQVAIDDQIERRDFPGVYLDDEKIRAIPSRHAEGVSFLEEETRKEVVVVANGLIEGKDPKPYFFAAVARELLR